MYQQVKGRFDGKIECPSCGNNDWEQFLYISAGDSITAGCKKCARLQEFKNESGMQHNQRGESSD